jgi:large-conductance mechanosensitive channel
MFKAIMSTDEGKITSLASFSLALGGVQDVIVDLEKFLHAVISLGQVAVAVFTVVYIIKKTRAIQIPSRKKRSKK